MPNEQTPPPASVCQIADQIVDGARQAEYGHPFDDFGKTAAMMTGAGFSWRGQPIGPEHIPILMSLVKISRMLNNKNAYHEDSAIDICGYMKTGQMVNKKHREREQFVKDCNPDLMIIPPLFNE